MGREQLSRGFRSSYSKKQLIKGIIEKAQHHHTAFNAFVAVPGMYVAEALSTERLFAFYSKDFTLDNSALLQTEGVYVSEHTD